MEKSRQYHQSSKRRVHDGRDKQAHKSRHDLRASQPHKTRPQSLARLVDDRELGSRSKPTAGQNDYLASWLKDAYPHRHHPPDMESVVKETRERKRARASSDVPGSPGEEPMLTKTAFDKRPRHKTHADKYDYKDGPGRKRKPPGEQRAVDPKGRRRNEPNLGPTRTTQKENTHGKHVKQGSQKVPDPYQRPTETSPGPEPNTSRPYRSGKKRDNGARFDKDVKEMIEFFRRRGESDRPKIARERHPRTPGEHYDLSGPPGSPSLVFGDDDAHPRRPWYSDASGRQSKPEKSPPTDKSTDVITWSASEYPPKSSTEHEKYPEKPSESPERTRPEKERIPAPNRGREGQIRVSQSQERRRDSRPGGKHRERSSQMPPPSPILYGRQKENIPPGSYGEPYHYSQRTLIEDPYEGLVGTHAMVDWRHRPPLGLGLRSFEWPPARTVTRPLLVDRGFEQSQLLPQRRDFGYEGRLSNLDAGYFPHSSQAGFLPRVEMGVPLGPMATLDARYPVEGTLATPNGYGYGTIEPVNRIPGIQAGANPYPPLETRNHPGVTYNLGTTDVMAPTYYSAKPVENPRKKLERLKREEFVERLEQETLGMFKPVPATDDLEFRDRKPIDCPTRPHEVSSNFEPDGLKSRSSSLEGGMGQVMTKRNPLPHLSAGLVTLTHGFTPLTPPVVPKPRIHQMPEKSCLSTVWERQSEA